MNQFLEKLKINMTYCRLYGNILDGHVDPDPTGMDPCFPQNVAQLIPNGHGVSLPSSLRPHESSMRETRYSRVLSF